MKRMIREERLKNAKREYIHPSYSYEVKLLNEIKLGLLSEARQTQEEFSRFEWATLSDNPIRNKRYSMICWCVLFTRAAIDAGVAHEDAFALSDLFINKIDRLSDLDVLQDFEFIMAEEFIELIREQRIEQYQYPISMVVKHIHANATKKLTVSGLAELFSMNPDYLSRRFHEVTGVSLVDYIQREKLEIAKYFLAYSTMRVSDISELLDFCNPGYFSQVFKKHTGMPPNAYRKENMPLAAGE